METAWWGALVRIGQALLACGPTLLVGWLIAALMERLLGREGTFKLFGGHSWRQLPQAWLIGMLLPVCSLGVIPVLRQMRKSGLSGGTILAFGMTAPLFNPISVLYGLTLSDPFAIFVFCIATLTIVTLLGTLWDALFPRNWIEPEPLPPTPYGVRRIGAVAVSMARQAADSSLFYVVLALMGVGMLAAVLPPGVLQKAANQNDSLAPLTMAAVATLAYVTPMVAIVQVASMFQHGNSIGAAFVLLVLGTGVNLGLLAWVGRHYGLRPLLVWAGLLGGLAVAAGYLIDRPLSPEGVQPADHTHAFDMYCNPFLQGATNLPADSRRLILESAAPYDLVASMMAAVILCVGGLLRWIDPTDRITDRLMEGAPPLARDVILPPKVVAAAALAGLVLASIGGCYLYYPPVAEIRKEMVAINAEIFAAANSKEWETIEFWIPQQEDWAHKLRVSSRMRWNPLSDLQLQRVDAFQASLEDLEHAAEDRDIQEARDASRKMAAAFTAMRESLGSP